MSNDNPENLANELSVMAVRLVRWLRAADPEPALSGPETSAMAVIVYSGGVTPSQLAELEQVRRPTISRLIEGLEQRDLILREDHPQDKRSTIIVATQKGLELWNTGQQRRVAPLAQRIAELRPEDKGHLTEIMPLLARLVAPPPQ